MTMSALDPQAASSASAATYAERTADLLPESSDAANGVESGHGIAARVGRLLLRWPADPVANVEQHLEQQLFALVGGIEICHTTNVLQRLGPIVGLTVDRVEIVENLLAWPHVRKTTGASDGRTG